MSSGHLDWEPGALADPRRGEPLSQTTRMTQVTLSLVSLKSRSATSRSWRRAFSRLLRDDEVPSCRLGPRAQLLCRCRSVQTGGDTCLCPPAPRRPPVPSQERAPARGAPQGPVVWVCLWFCLSLLVHTLRLKLQV